MDQQLKQTDVKQSVLDALGGRGKPALFITELAALLRRSGVAQAALDQAIAELAATDTLVVRDNFCADPHLATVDLRVAALVPAGADGYAAALGNIDLVWNQWLGEFLANHRCG